MAAEGDNNVWLFTYTGADDERIPEHVTHVIVHELTTAVREVAFYMHQNIIEVICHDKVERIEPRAFYDCPSLRRVIMPSVKVAEDWAFCECQALTDVDCEKLEIIKECAFWCCISLTSIHLPYTKIVKRQAFGGCAALINVKFCSKLERIEGWAFSACDFLERITIPLKDGLMLTDNTFQGCVALKHVDLVEESELQETIAALLLEDWRNDMNEEIDSINQILPIALAGGWGPNIDDVDEGEKAQAMRRWIRSVLGKIIHFKAEHQRLLDEAGTTLELILPAEIAINNVLPILALPSYTFDGEDEEDDTDNQ